MLKLLFLVSFIPLLVSAETPLPSSHYVFAPAEAAHTHGVSVDLDQENEPALKRFFKENQDQSVFILVPGYGNRQSTNPVAVHGEAKKRLKLAVTFFLQNPSHSFFILSGGNVWPRGTPYNEALEMKKYLMSHYKIPEEKILIEPYARNSVTNLRNVGRLLIAMGAKKTFIVTTAAQRLYFAFPYLSTMALRSWRILGGLPGRINFSSGNKLIFTPYQRVMNRGQHPLDP